MTNDYRAQYEKQEYPAVSFNDYYANEETQQQNRGIPLIFIIALLIPVCAAILLILYILRVEFRLVEITPESPNLIMIMTASAAPAPTETIAATSAAQAFQPSPFPSPTPTASPNYELTATMESINKEQARINQEATAISAKLTQVQDEANRIALELQKQEAELTAEVLKSYKAEEQAKQTAIWDRLTRTAEILDAQGTKTVEQMIFENITFQEEQRIKIETANNKKENDLKLQNTIRIILQILLIFGGFIVLFIGYIIYKWERLRRKTAALQEQKIRRANADRQISEIYKEIDRENAIELWSLLKISVQYYTDLQINGLQQITIPGHHLIKKYSWGGAGKWTRVTDVLASRHHLRKTNTGSQLVYGNLGDWLEIVERGLLYDPDPISKLKLARTT